MIRKNDIIEGITIKDGFTISSGDIAIRSNTSIITPGTGTMSIDFKIDEITTLYQVADVETKVQVSEFVKIASKNTMDERYIEVHKDSINLGGIGSGFVYAGPGGELTTSLNGGTISVISVGATGATGPGGTINQNEIAFGTGTGITSSPALTILDDSGYRVLSIGNPYNAQINLWDGSNAGFTKIISGDSQININNFNDDNIISFQSDSYKTTRLRNTFDNITIGNGNQIVSTLAPFPINNTILLGGNTNQVDVYNSQGAFNNGGQGIIGGANNKLKAPVNDWIIGGAENTIWSYRTFGGERMSIISSYGSTMSASGNSTILGGYRNITGEGFNLSIVGGQENKNELSYNSIIVGGQNNHIFGYSAASTQNSVILGGRNLTLYNEIDLVYVPTLRIDSVTASGTASVKLLTYGTTKNVEYINLYTEITYSNLSTLRSSNGLIPGTLYKITDRGDRGIFLRALSNSQLDKKGTRLMLCPTNYLPGIYSGVYNKGVWYPGMTASANQLAIWGGQVWKNNAGVSGTASSIVALDSNWTLVDKTTFSNGEYEEKQFEISYDITNDWIEGQKDGYGNEVGKDYTFMGQHIGTYSWISYNPCDTTDWNLTKIILNDDSSYGMGTYSYMNSNICPEGIFNNSTKGNYLKKFRISNNICSSIYNNRVCIIIYNNSNGGSINDNNLYTIDHNTTQNINSFKRSIFGNVSPITFTGPAYPLGEISFNNCISIEDNISSGDLEITSNRCFFIRNNTGTVISINTNNNNGDIRYNTTNGGISGNSNNGDISGNSNTGNIFANKNNGQIGSNSNTGSIIRNVNNGWIVSNSSAGTISDTQVNK